MARRKIKGGYDLFSKFSWYVPGIGGAFALLGWVLAGVLLGSIVVFVFSLVAGPELSAEYGVMIAYPLQFIPAMLYASSQSRLLSWNTPGLALDGKNFAPLGGFVSALVVSVGMVALIIVTDAINAAMPPVPEWLKASLGSLTEGKLWVSLLCVSVMAPLFEEWLCRGMVLRGLLGNGMKPQWAIVVSALFFALIHMNPWQAIPAFIFGCFMGYVYYKTGSLWLTMLMHCVNNTIAVAAAHIPSLKDVDTLLDLMGNSYWALFAGAIAVFAGMVMLLRKIPALGPKGSCRTVEPMM